MCNTFIPQIKGKCYYKNVILHWLWNVNKIYALISVHISQSNTFHGQSKGHSRAPYLILPCSHGNITQKHSSLVRPTLWSVLYVQYIWRTISLVNWDIMHIGRIFSLTNRTIFSAHCFIKHMIISSVGLLLIKAKIAKPPN